MNERTSKKINRRAKEVLLAWMQSLVDKESAKKYNLHNVLSFSPKQTHLYYNDGTYHVSAYTYKWFVNQIKKLYSYKELQSITLTDCKEVAN